MIVGDGPSGPLSPPSTSPLPPFLLLGPRVFAGAIQGGRGREVIQESS